MSRQRGFTVALVALVAVSGCKDKPPAGPPPGGPPPSPVTLTPAIEKRVSIELEAVGSVQPVATVSVRSQITGPVLAISFTDGQLVKKGDPIATIDPRPFEIAKKQAEAALARDQALVMQAEATKAQREADVRQAEALTSRGTAEHDQARRAERRTKALADSDLVAREDFDKLRTVTSVTEATLRGSRAQTEHARSAIRAAEAAITGAKAALAADQAAIDQAELLRTYTTIVAPIDGRAGARLVPAGNIVKANDEVLVVITQVAPIYVAFSLPEVRLPEVLSRHEKAPLEVVVREPGSRNVIATGTLVFINNTVDATTGTILMKAQFTNEDRALWPGRFLDVTVRLEQRTALTVPSRAVQAGQQGPLVFVVGADKTAEVRLVKVGLRIDGDALIEDGLKAGERVVIDGQSKLRKGAKVRIPAEETPTAAPAPKAAGPDAR